MRRSAALIETWRGQRRKAAFARARELATQQGAVLVFDEVKTGFRVATGGYQELSGVTPDLAAFGKALANGFPIAAVCGNAALMDRVRSTWVSSTLACDTTALAAARAVLHLHAEESVCDELARNVVAAAQAHHDDNRHTRRTHCSKRTVQSLTRLAGEDEKS